MYYAELVDRNWGFLTPQDQERIKQAKVLLAGCGLGSNIAVLAARTGFTKFILADGDKVEINNLNRQTFHLDQVGNNKAEATAQLIQEVNPEVEMEIFPHFITEHEAATLVTKTNLIVNMVDPSPALFTLNEVARSQNKLTLFPLNVGFGGVALAFSADSVTLEEMLEGKVISAELFLRLIERVMLYLPHLSNYLEKLSESKDDILRGARSGPQLGVAASINASLIVTAMIRWVLGVPLKVAPEPLALDAWFCSE